jgi:hypothetical protein
VCYRCALAMVWVPVAYRWPIAAIGPVPDSGARTRKAATRR